MQTDLELLGTAVKNKKYNDAEALVHTLKGRLGFLDNDEQVRSLLTLFDQIQKALNSRDNGELVGLIDSVNIRLDKFFEYGVLA